MIIPLAVAEKRSVDVTNKRHITPLYINRREREVTISEGEGKP